MVDLSSFASTLGGKAKAVVDTTRLQRALTLVDQQGLRLSYEAAAYFAHRLGLINDSQLKVPQSVSSLLNQVTCPWTVCRKDGTYHQNAMSKFAQAPEGFKSRNVIQSSHAEAAFASIETALKPTS